MKRSFATLLPIASFSYSPAYVLKIPKRFEILTSVLPSSCSEHHDTFDTLVQISLVYLVKNPLKLVTSEYNLILFYKLCIQVYFPVTLEVNCNKSNFSNCKRMVKPLLWHCHLFKFLFYSKNLCMKVLELVFFL